MDDSKVALYLVTGIGVYSAVIVLGILRAVEVGIAWQNIVGGVVLLTFLAALITMLTLRDIAQKWQRPD